MRNLTEEAIKYAQDETIRQYPYLSSKHTRQNLSPMQKMQVIGVLDWHYSIYMDAAINAIKNPLVV